MSSNFGFELLQRVSIACYAERCISYDRFCPTVRASDRLSVTRWYHAKTTPATIMRSSLEDSPMVDDGNFWRFEWLCLRKLQR